MLTNGKNQSNKDSLPVVKLYHPELNFIFLVGEIRQGGTAWGLCVLGDEAPEYCVMQLSEIVKFKGKRGVRVKRDMKFIAYFSLKVYWDAANQYQRIIEDPQILHRFAF